MRTRAAIAFVHIAHWAATRIQDSWRMKKLGHDSAKIIMALRLDEVGLYVRAELELGRAVGGNEVDEWNKDRERMRW